MLLAGFRFGSWLLVGAAIMFVSASVLMARRERELLQATMRRREWERLWCGASHSLGHGWPTRCGRWSCAGIVVG
jgi:hypothetical protein